MAPWQVRSIGSLKEDPIPSTNTQPMVLRNEENCREPFNIPVTGIAKMIPKARNATDTVLAEIRPESVLPGTIPLDQNCTHELASRYVCQEKLNGAYVLWTGKELYSKNGQLIHELPVPFRTAMVPTRTACKCRRSFLRHFRM